MRQSIELKKWLLATRPWSFPASMMPALIILAYMFYLSRSIGAAHISFTNGLWALFGVVLFQAAGNLISDYFDYKYKVDQKDTYGSSRLIVDGIFAPKTILRYGLVLLAIGATIGICLVGRTNTTLLYIGVAGVLGTYFYYQLKYHALGDVLIFILYGLLVALGTMFVMTGKINTDALWISAPVGLLVVNILHANNSRDIASDRRAGISTLAMKIGLPASRILYVVLEVTAYVLVLALIVWGKLPYMSALVYLSLPIAIRNMRMMLRAQEGAAESIRDLDKESAKLVLVYSLLMVVGYLIAAFL